jgi:hypothetical protein
MNKEGRGTKGNIRKSRKMKRNRGRKMKGTATMQEN